MREEKWELGGSVIIREEQRRRVNMRREGVGKREKQPKKIGEGRGGVAYCMMTHELL